MYQVLEWLDENQHRSYPLQVHNSKEVVLQGVGRLSAGALTPQGWLVNAATSPVTGQKANFTTQISPGDLLQVQGIRAEVKDAPITSTSLYTVSALAGLPPGSFDFSVVKNNFSLDTTNTRDTSFEGLFLDANIVYQTAPSNLSLAGQLISIVKSGNDLVISVYEQPLFTLTDYLTADYPAYVRNAAGSLLVLGSVARYISTGYTFLNQFFEPSTITVLSEKWRGVSSLTFSSFAPLQGALVFQEGYQVQLSPSDASTLAVAADRQLGEPLGCTRLFPEDIAPNDCNSAVAQINGAAPKAAFGELTMVGEGPVQIYPDPDRHRIYVGLSFGATDICPVFPTRPK